MGSAFRRIFLNPAAFDFAQARKAGSHSVGSDVRDEDCQQELLVRRVQPEVVVQEIIEHAKATLAFGILSSMSTMSKSPVENRTWRRSIVWKPRRR